MNGQASLEFLLVLAVIIMVVLSISSTMIQIAKEIKSLDTSERDLSMKLQEKVAQDSRITGVTGPYRRWEIAGD